MKKRSSLSHVALVTGTAVLSFMLLSGCRGAEEKANETIESSTQNFIDATTESTKNFIESTTQAVAGAVNQAQEAAVTSVGMPAKNLVSLKLETASPVGKMTELVIDHEVGDIEIVAGKGDQIKVTAEVVAQDRKSTSEKLTKVFEQAEVSIQKDGNQAHILTHAKDDPKRSLWDWGQSTYNYSEFGINYTIELPADIITAYQVSNNVGDVSLNGLSGTFRLNNEVGEVDLVSAGFTGASKIKVSTGSVKLDIDSLDKKGTLEVNTAIGDIQVDLDESVDCSIDTKIALGDLTSTLNKSRKGNGDSPISLSVDVGSIDLN